MKVYKPKYKLQEEAGAVLSDKAFDEISSKIEKLKPDSAEGEKVLDVIDTFKSAEKMGATKRAWEFIKKHLNETYVAKLLKQEMERIENSDYKKEFRYFSNDKSGNVSVVSEFISLALQALTYHAMEEKTILKSEFARKLLGEESIGWHPLDDVDIRMAVADGITLAFDDIENAGKKSSDPQEIANALEENSSVDATSVIDIPMNKKLFLCEHYEDETGSKVPNDLSWSQLPDVIANTAAAALSTLVREGIVRAVEEIDQSVKKFGLNWATASLSFGALGHIAHQSEEDLDDNTRVMHYGKVEGGPAIDLYMIQYSDNGANITLYFRKNV